MSQELVFVRLNQVLARQPFVSCALALLVIATTPAKQARAAT